MLWGLFGVCCVMEMNWQLLHEYYQIWCGKEGWKGVAISKEIVREGVAISKEIVREGVARSE